MAALNTFVVTSGAISEDPEVRISRWEEAVQYSSTYLYKTQTDCSRTIRPCSQAHHPRKFSQQLRLIHLRRIASNNNLGILAWRCLQAICCAKAESGAES